MQRLLIAAVGAALLAGTAASAFADDYPPCTTPMQDHCRVVNHGWHHRPPPPPPHHHHHHH
jgi:hypothetical protein